MTINKYQQLWTFADEAFNGSGGFSDGGYIVKYPRESDDKYQERKKIAYYTNIFSSKVNRYIGYLSKHTPTRDTPNKMIRMIFDNVDNKGNSINVFMSNFAKNAKVRGCNLILIDMPKTLPSDLKTQLDTRALPYFVEIQPERVTEYKIGQNGKFEYIAFSDVLDESVYGKSSTKNIIRYYDKTKWIVFDTDNTILETGEHNLNECPVILFSENGSFPTSGEFTQIAGLAKRHYNLTSELDEILRSQTFSILTIQADNPSDVEIKLSTDNAISYAKECNMPEFIAPPSAPAEIYIQKIKDIENQIDKIAFDVSTNQSKESGIALDIKFQGLSASLSNFAVRLEDLELRAFELVYKYLNLNFDITISYPKNFNIIDIEKEISILSEMKQLIDSPTYFKLKTLQIISNDLNTIDVEEFDKISAEIEDISKET